MRWLLHGTLAAAVPDALRRHGHVASSQAELKLNSDDPLELLKQANQRQVEVITNDQELANAPFSEQASRFGRTIVFLKLEGGEVEQADAIDRLFNRYKRLTPGRLYTVTATRVKVRQLPTTR
jgi:hypothetical protein